MPRRDTYPPHIVAQMQASAAETQTLADLFPQLAELNVAVIQGGETIRRLTLASPAGDYVRCEHPPCQDGGHSPITRLRREIEAGKTEISAFARCSGRESMGRGQWRSCGGRSLRLVGTAVYRPGATAGAPGPAAPGATS